MATKSSGAGISGALKRVLVGRALSMHSQEHQLLPKFLALPVFSSDPLSSVAYATEEMMLVLVTAGVATLTYRLPIAFAIAALLAIVVTSYRQTVKAYPRGGGSYIVARENLGTVPGLTAAAAILTDYVLTVAVSVTAGTIAITSAAPSLADHKVLIASVLVAFVTAANLRGVKEAGALFALPTYGFVAIVGSTIALGLWQCVSSGCHLADTADLPVEPVAGVTLFLLLRAFASGATALTGVEAIADGVQAFRRPQARNAAATLAIMAVISISMFLGITLLSQLLQVRIDEEVAHSRSVLSLIGDAIWGGGVGFLLLQVFTAGILVLAANTAYQDFPRLSSILARDRFLPSQFRNRGDRLVFSNGVVVLAALAIGLIWYYDASLTRLIQLYVIGVFTAFTLSQAGMVRRWFRIKGDGWRWRAVLNGVGATATGVVLVIATITKFAAGAKVVVVAIPLIVLLFLGIHRHYRRIADVLAAGRFTGDVTASNAFVLLVPDFGSATIDAISYLFTIRCEQLAPLWVGPTSGFETAKERWREVTPRYGDLELLAGSDEHPIRALRRYLKARDTVTDYLTVVIPEVVTSASLWQLVRQRTAFLLKTTLLFRPGIVVTNVPLLPGEVAPEPGRRPVERPRSEVVVPVSSVHDATVRAVVYAKALQPSSVEALFMVTDPEEVPAVVAAWHDRRLDVPLVLVEAPFRDLGVPLVEEIRSRTDRGDTVVTVVIPELVPEHWWQNILHNQTALFFKRILLFEPDTVVTSVPFHLGDPEGLAGAVAGERSPTAPAVR
ncbi:MAG TPA: APC family permease [Actinomycetota bacterium]|nr:APC family permease [Actinomycetota bacterium]